VKRFDQPIYVTRPYLPALEDFQKGCAEIWANQWLSNNGPMARRFHDALSAYMGVPATNLALFANGTLSLELAFAALGISSGEVITTPFTFVATAHAIVRAGATPVFADIDPNTLCLSPEAAERAITPRTRAIVPVHVYGNPCDVAGFQRLADQYSVKIVYDAAHAFGIPSLATAGDVSMFSFHPTKLFHSAEGGLLVFRDPSLQERLFELRNFAIHSETECTAVGTNAKMNEFQALMGLLCLERMPALLARRREIHDAYAAAFDGHPSVRLLPHSLNRAYVPVLFPDFATRERVYNGLRDQCNVFARRYFYPLLTDFPPYAASRTSCPVAEDLSRRVLTLPTYHSLSLPTVHSIARSIVQMIKDCQ
jgi:dTDP-4-amino-4,6-dideoxygalactose transaminase